MVAEFTLAVPRHLDQHLSNPFQCEPAMIIPIAMIPTSFAPLIRQTTEKMGQFHPHQFGKILVRRLPYLLAHHLKKFSQSPLDTLAKLLKLCYAKVNLHRLLSPFF